MSAPRTVGQSTAERKAAETALGSLVRRFAPRHGRLVAAVRRHLAKLLPTANELVYEYHDAFVISFAPGERGHEGVFAVRAGAAGVKLYFNQGKTLADPSRLLNGSGLTRWIMLEGPATLAEPGVAALIKAAVAHNRVPFAASGRGATIVRPTAAGERSQAKRTKTAAALKK